MLSTNELKAITEKLNLEKERLVSASSYQVTELQLDREDFADEVDLATSERNQAMAMQLRNRNQQLLKKIDQALHRIHNHSYGICFDCDEPIEAKRLEARPFTTLCIHCKEQEERDARMAQST